jgi:putative flippase GtrA
MSGTGSRRRATTEAAARTLAIALFGFLLVGVANTAVGFAVILALEFGLGVGPHLANAGGYAVGLVLSFALNRRFVFARDGPVGRSAPRFAVAALAAFGINQGVLLLADRWPGPGAPSAVAAQAMAVASYTLALFALSRWWVFRAASAV